MLDSIKLNFNGANSLLLHNWLFLLIRKHLLALSRITKMNKNASFPLKELKVYKEKQKGRTRDSIKDPI